MRIVRTICNTLVLLLMVSCIPSQAVMPTASTVPVSETPELTATIVIPTFTYTPTKLDTSTPENQIETIQKNFAESYYEVAISTGQFDVTREQILSGALIEEAKLWEDTYFSEDTKPISLEIGFFGMYAWDMELAVAKDFVKKEYFTKQNSPCKVVAVYTYPADSYPESYSRMAIVIQAWNTRKGIQYLQYYSVIGDYHHSNIDSQTILTPYYERDKSVYYSHMYADIADKEIPLEDLWLKHLDDVQGMMDDWVETGIIPENLSYIPLDPIFVHSY
jgi:hypothetical protein